uniref:Ubiquinone biosynthesis O-methyltransferase, mitochondrial n=1 Tax=Aceria tosichella TaxID=561515 RepID=A0A6G1S5C7_9ACAR
MFSNVRGLKVVLKRLDCHTRLNNGGLIYEPIGGKFHWTSKRLVHNKLDTMRVEPISTGLIYQQTTRHTSTSKKADGLNKPPYGQETNTATNLDPLDVFRRNATKWWSGKEFSLLRSMNEIRLPFIVNGLGKPIHEAKLMDVGCGGGILSEPLARLGANVTGIDPVFESINQAQLHAQTDPDLKERLKYRNCNIEDLSAHPEHMEAYDGLIASEVLEHIENVEDFLLHCTKVLKPNGSLFITTINQTPLSWLGVIFFGEYVLKQLPKGTHTYDMFVNVKGLKVMLERMGYHIRLVNGFMYEPIGGKFHWTPTTLTHYAMHAVKVKPISTGLNYQQKRHAPKNKKADRPKRPLDDQEMSTVIDIAAYRQKVEAIINEFKDHLDTKLTTRANTSTFETLKVTLDGLNEPLELRDIAQISMKGENLIVINLSTMPEAVKPTVKALTSLGNIMNPQIEVNNIFVPVPRVTREHRENLVAAAKKAATESKDKLRTLFSAFSAKAKVNKNGVSIDLVHDTIDNLQFDTSKRIQQIDTLLKTRADQLLNQGN